MELADGAKLKVNVWFQSMIYLYTSSKRVNDKCDTALLQSFFTAESFDVVLKQSYDLLHFATIQ